MGMELDRLKGYSHCPEFEYVDVVAPDLGRPCTLHNLISIMYVSMNRWTSGLGNSLVVIAPDEHRPTISECCESQVSPGQLPRIHIELSVHHHVLLRCNDP